VSASPVRLESRIAAQLACLREPAPCELERWRTALTLALCAGDLQRAVRAVTGACGLIPLASALDDIVAPAMHDVGLLWEREEITVADEHLATAAAHRLLGALAPSLQVAAPMSRETVLLVTPAPERHTTGLLMANDVLAGAGYSTVLLGGGLPDASFRSALARHNPRVVAISSTMCFPDAIAETVTLVREALPGTPLLVGGAAANLFPRVAPVRRVERIDELLRSVRVLGLKERPGEF
jgi:MerR family transcriptional regulator, light-induced transcriptional regulator